MIKTADPLSMTLMGWMPSGQPVTDVSWRARHRVVQAAVWVSVPALVLVGLSGPMPVAETILLTAIIAGFAAAGLLLTPREAKAEITSFGLILASFAGVELSGGQVHAHLFILSAVALVSLYQRWGPLLYTIAAVLFDHIVLGFFAPERVFTMTGMSGTHGAMPTTAYSPSQITLMVLSHTAAVGIEVFAILLFWHFSEQLSDKLQKSLDELRLREEQLHHQATHDSLTGLPNRARFADEVMTRLTQHASFAVLMLDIDDFKQINDTYGHHAGDLMLEAAAQRISGCVREADVSARLGGDEFSVLLSTATGLREIQGVADRIIEAMAQPFRLDDIDVTINVSIGIAHTDDTLTLQDLMHKADSAMYVAKREGKGRWVYPPPLAPVVS